MQKSSKWCEATQIEIESDLANLFIASSMTGGTGRQQPDLGHLKIAKSSLELIWPPHDLRLIRATAFSPSPPAL
jgi:hypothetical protein